MTGPRLYRVSLILSVAGGLLTTLELISAEFIWSTWAWVTSEGHSVWSPPDFSKWFDTPNRYPGPIGELGVLIWAFTVGAGTVFVLSKHSLRSFLKNPSTSAGWPITGFLIGLSSGLISCALGSFFAVLVLVSTLKPVSFELLLITLLIYSAMALNLVGAPIGLIGGIVGSVSELVLRRIYRAIAPPATSPDK
jgi:hypothetical protein